MIIVISKDLPILVPKENIFTFDVNSSLTKTWATEIETMTIKVKKIFKYIIKLN